MSAPGKSVDSAAPILTVDDGIAWESPFRRILTASQMRVAIIFALSRVAPGTIIANSSPPIRAKISSGLNVAETVVAKLTSTRSPVACPWVSLTALK